MLQELITEFGWGVTTEYEDASLPEDERKVVQRTLHITVLAAAPFLGPDGSQLKFPVKTIQIPFGTDQRTGRLTAELVSKALVGEELPPDILVAKTMTGHLGPGGMPR